MASLTGQLVAETYKALLKLIDNDILTASEKQITDGFGGGSNVFIDSQGFLRANKYKITNGLATQFLKADGSLDSNAYLTSITGAQVITALGYTPVPTTRTITINGETHNLAADNSWTVGVTAAIWGNITGTLSNQTDLQNALNAKYNNPTGTISQYIRGDGTLATFPTMPGGLPTGGSAGQILSKIDATDYNTHWIDNYATQTKNEVKLGQTLTKGTPVYVSSANGTNIIVSAASNTSEALSSKTLGLLETGGATNDLVKCVTFGLLAGLDTSAASAGDPVWLGPNGTLIYGLVNKPYAPAHLVYIGVVTRVQSNNGEIFVNVQNGFELKEIHDVYIADPANNHGLFYDIADGLWKNKSIASALGYAPEQPLTFSSPLVRTANTISIPVANSTQNGYLSSTLYDFFYAKQAQLNGTGLVRMDGITVTYDNNAYITASALAGYQTVANMQDQLLIETGKYPSSNAVIAALGTKQPLDSDLTAIAALTGTVGFLRKTAADTWSLDTSTYLTTGDASTTYLAITTAASTYQRLDKMVSNLLPSSTEYPNSNAVINALALKADAANPVFTGNMTISGATPRLYFVDTDQNPDYTVFIDSGYFYIYDQTAGATRFSINSSGNINAGVGKSITAGSFIKESGTSSQYLMADGSVSTFAGVTGSGSTNYIPKWTSASGLGNSVIYDHSDAISIATTSNINGVRLQVAASSASWISGTFGGTGNGDKVVIGNIAGPTIGGHNSALSAWSTLAINPDGGNVMVGTQTNSGYKFDVNGTGRFSGVLTIKTSSVGGSYYGGLIVEENSEAAIQIKGLNYSSIYFSDAANAYEAAIVYNHSTNNLELRGSGNTADLTIASNGGGLFSSTLQTNGNIGIRVTPSTAADQYLTTGDAGIANSNTYFGTGQVRIGGGADHVANTVLSVAPGVVNFDRPGVGGGALKIFSNGNIGINQTTDGGYKLDVNGSVRFSSSLTATSLSIASTANSTNPASGSIVSAGGLGLGGDIFMHPFNANQSNYGYIKTAATSVNTTTLTIGTTYGFGVNVDALSIYNGSATFSGSISATSLYLNGSDSGGTIAYISTNVNGLPATNGIAQPNAALRLRGGDNAILDFGLNSVNTWIQATDKSSLGTYYNILLNPRGGNIGVGVTAPGEKFEVNGSIKAIGRTVLATSTGGLTMGYESGIGYLETWNSSPLIIRTYNYQSFNVSGTQYLKINTNGNILVNTNTDAGYNLYVNGQISMDTGSFKAILGSLQASWGGSTAYPTLYGNTADRWVMHINPHITYTQNGVNGYTGTTYGAMLRMAGNASASVYWDLGVGVCNVGADVFAIGRNSTALVTISNGGNITAAAFFESSDIRLKTLIENNPIIDGIEKLEAKLYEKNGKIELGYFAQDAELIIPHAVQKGTDGFLNLSYREVHTAKIARLEQRVEELEKQLNLN